MKYKTKFCFQVVDNLDTGSQKIYELEGDNIIDAIQNSKIPVEVFNHAINLYSPLAREHLEMIAERVNRRNKTL